jgi:membrane-associated phospholipid phosphatase
MEGSHALARALTNLLNPFTIFTALYVLVALRGSPTPEALLYTLLELAAAAAVAGYVLLRRYRRRAGDFWLSERSERLVPALVLLGCFAALLLTLLLLGAPGELVRVTLSMGLASAAAAGVTAVWKVSAHAAVAGHAAAAGVLLLGGSGLLFVLALPLVLWSRVAAKAHTPAQTLAGAALGGTFAAALLL